MLRRCIRTIGSGFGPCAYRAQSGLNRHTTIAFCRPARFSGWKRTCLIEATACLCKCQNSCAFLFSFLCLLDEGHGIRRTATTIGAATRWPGSPRLEPSAETTRPEESTAPGVPLGTGTCVRFARPPRRGGGLRRRARADWGGRAFHTTAWVSAGGCRAGNPRGATDAGRCSRGR